MVPTPSEENVLVALLSVLNDAHKLVEKSLKKNETYRGMCICAQIHCTQMVAAIVRNLVFHRRSLPHIFTFDESTVAGMSVVNKMILFPNPGRNEA